MEVKIMKLNSGWMFHQGEVLDHVLPDYGKDEWEPIDLPHTWNDIDTFTDSRGYYRGIGWYKRHLTIDQNIIEKAIFLEFGAVYGYAEIWINNVYKGKYMSAYTGFSVNISKEVRVGCDNLIVVRADNKHNPAVLPSKEEPDYNLYGGIYREVKLLVKNKDHIKWQGVHIRTICIGDTDAILEVSAEIEWTGQFDAKLAVDIFDKKQKFVTSADILPAAEYTNYQIYTQTVLIDRPCLWSPDEPFLYKAVINLKNHLNQLLDCTEVLFGIRQFSFDASKGFSLNNKPLKLKGVNRHQCYPGLGNAVPASLQIQDAVLLKTMGCNFVRCSHYPQHEAFLEACDYLGILVYEEIASWQSIENEAFKNSAKKMLEDMIRRDWNHPSIIIWGLMNEGRDRDFLLDMHHLAKKLDAERLTCYADNRLYDSGIYYGGISVGTVSVTDILGVNYQLDTIDQFHQQYPNLPLLVAEHSNACMPRGNHDGMIKQLRQVAADLDIIENRDYIAGGVLWSMHDYGSDYEFAWPIQDSGVVDAYRIPKYIYHFLACRWVHNPKVFIAGHWSFTGEKGQVKQMMVVHNCDEVELRLNGKVVGRKRDQIAFFDIVYKPGKLEAVGFRDGQETVFALETAGEPAVVRLTSSCQTMIADPAEVCVLTAQVLDAQGKSVPDIDLYLSIQLDQQLGTICGIGGSQTIKITDGIGRVVFRAGDVAGTETITVCHDHLKSRSIQIQLTSGPDIVPVVSQISHVAEQKQDRYHTGQWKYSE